MTRDAARRSGRRRRAARAREQPGARARLRSRRRAPPSQEDGPLSRARQRHGFARDREILRMWRVLDGDAAGARVAGRRRGAHVRDADARAVHALLDEAYSGWDRELRRRVPHDDVARVHDRHDEFDPALWFVVERDGELVACALHWREHQGRGWVKDIVVARASAGAGSATRCCTTPSARTRHAASSASA